jgi:hypothetical protein
MKDHVIPITFGFLSAAVVATALCLFLGSGWGQSNTKNRAVSHPGPKKDVDSNMR